MKYFGCTDAPDSRDYKVEEVLGGEYTHIPATLDLEKDLDIPILNQFTGAWSKVACTAFGLCRASSIMNSREHKENILIDPQPIWEEMVKQGRTFDKGSTLQNALKTAVSFGLFQKEKKYPISGYARVEKKDWKEWMAKGYPIYTGHPYNKTTWNRMRDEGTFKFDGGSGGHAVCAIGYNEEGIWLMNSGGTSWGKYKNGTFFAPNDQIEHLFTGYVIFDIKDSTEYFQKKLYLKKLSAIYLLAEAIKEDDLQDDMTLIKDIVHARAEEIRNEIE